jgi:hypothetical protein
MIRVRSSAVAAACLAAGVALGGCKSGGGSPVDGGPSANCPTADELISDFENDNSLAPVGGRQGGWYTYGDDVGMFFKSSGYDIGEGNPNCSATGSLHVKGTGFAMWGAATGVDWKPRPGDGDGGYGEKMTYDASAYRGISFWAKVGPKSIKKMRVNFPDIDTHPDLGSCKTCWNHFMKEVELTTDWQEYQISFKELAQRAGWGEPRPKSVQPNQLYALTFAMEGGGDFELWVDDVKFLQCRK